DAILELDAQRRGLLTEVEQLKAERNQASRAIGKLPAGEEREAKIAAMKQVGERIGQIDEQIRQVEGRLNALLLSVPNLPDASVPVAPDESHNAVVAQEGQAERQDWQLAHWDLGPKLEIIDFERGVKLSGTRFYVLNGLGARLQRALIAWMIDVHLEQGYTEVYPPPLVRGECLVGTGQLPKFGETLYRDAEDDLWLIPTAEVPVTNLYRDEIMEGDKLPVHHVAYTPCFRREKMSAGRDVRGIKRGHVFDKVEMVKFCKPEDSAAEMDTLVDNAREVCRRLDIPHRVVQMCTGDLSFTAAAKYDVEVWAPGCGEWLEVSSCSNFKDFQARRANIRFRRDKSSKPEFVHTLNGSGLGLPRTLIAVLENYQDQDGSIRVPPVLRPYMGGVELIRKA
ncbi:MAG: serine--tRNA ligase, partial [Thermoflexales bacterium]|nr:serine--tRNA ligase [Thermoflexales bacterium]